MSLPATGFKANCGIFGMAGVMAGSVPPNRVPPPTAFGPYPRIGMAGVSGTRSVLSTKRTFPHRYEPLAIGQELTDWRKTSSPSSEGFDKGSFRSFLFDRPPGWDPVEDAAELVEEESEHTITDFFRTRQTISLDAVKLARKAFNAQATKDFEYKETVIRRVTDVYSKAKLSGLAPSTFRQYHSRVYQLVKAGYEPTLPGLGRFLAERAFAEDSRFFAHSSLSTWRSAVVHFGVALGYYFPTSRDITEFRKLKAGLKGMNAEGVTRVKGAITRKGVQEMVEWAKSNVAPQDQTWFVDGIIVQHAFGLRTSEVPNVAKHNCRLDPQSPLQFLHTCPKNKDALAYHRDDMKVEYHYSDTFWKEELDRISSRATDASPYWISGWCSWKANDYVKLCSVSLGWNPLLFWSNHGIRHGAAVDAARNATYPANASKAARKEAEDLAVFRRTAQLSEEMRRFYAEPEPFRYGRALELKLISTTPAEIQETQRRVSLIREEAKKFLTVRNQEEVDDFELTFEDEAALANATPSQYLALLRSTLRKYKTNKDSDDDSDEESEDLAKRAKPKPTKQAQGKRKAAIVKKAAPKKAKKAVGKKAAPKKTAKRGKKAAPKKVGKRKVK